MALGTPTRAQTAGAKREAIFHDLITFAGDGAYPAGGTAGFLAWFRAMSGRAGATILAVIDQSQPDTLSVLSYDHTNDKLFARVRTTGVESAVGNQSAVTYRLLVISK
jgi:hypothetical protein